MGLICYRDNIGIGSELRSWGSGATSKISHVLPLKDSGT